MTTGADWLDQARRLLEVVRAPEPASATAAGPETEHPADCSWCPVCQVAAVLRGERPEVTAAVADLLTTAAAALREFAADVPPSPPADEPADGPADGTGDGTAAPPAAQRIDIA